MLRVLGVLLLVALLLDVVWTTMGVGGGLLTRRLARQLYGIGLAVYRRVPSRVVLVWTGIGVLLSVFFVWVVLLWTGWALIFVDDPSAVVKAATDEPAGVWSRIYFTGFTIFTLGTGDYHAGGPLWEVLMAVASLNGLFLVTFSITYLLPIVQAATQKRQIAVVISSLGLTAPAVLLHARNDDGDCTGLNDHLTTLVPSLAQLEQQHLTYPILHFLHGRRRSEALSLSVAALDEALTIMECGLHDRCGVPPSAYRPIRQVITQFLDTLENAFIDPIDEPPPLPDLTPLREAGFAVVPDEAFAERVDGLAERRRLLAALVQHEGWAWRFNDVDRDTDAPTRALHHGWQRPS